jgi:hypothetical protein
LDVKRRLAGNWLGGSVAIGEGDHVFQSGEKEVSVRGVDWLILDVDGTWRQRVDTFGPWFIRNPSE